MNSKNELGAISGLLVGCIIFGLGSLIVAHVPIGSYAIAFWRIFIAFWIFAALCFLRRLPLPRHRLALFSLC